MSFLKIKNQTIAILVPKLSVSAKFKQAASCHRTSVQAASCHRTSVFHSLLETMSPCAWRNTTSVASTIVWVVLAPMFDEVYDGLSLTMFRTLSIAFEDFECLHWYRNELINFANFKFFYSKTTMAWDGYSFWNSLWFKIKFSIVSEHCWGTNRHRWRGVHREPHDHGTYSPGLHEERTIQELTLQTRFMKF